jgi:hypothetical protein
MTSGTVINVMSILFRRFSNVTKPAAREVKWRGDESEKCNGLV